MSDLAHALADDVLEELEGRISDIYADAEDEAERILTEYLDGMRARDDSLREKYAAGGMTAMEYRSKRRRMLFSGRAWADVLERMADVYTGALEEASDVLAEVLPGVYAVNAAYAEYCVEKQSGIELYGGIYTEADVRRRLAGNPEMIVFPSVDRAKDRRWNRQRITAEMMQGIMRNIPAESLADCLREVTDGAYASAMGTARALITAAENGGRQYVFSLAWDAAVPMRKMWDAVEDHRVRASHKAADGQTVDMDAPFIVGGEALMYPGDPSGSPWNTKNCRCCMVISAGGIGIGTWGANDFDEWLKRKGG